MFAFKALFISGIVYVVWFENIECNVFPDQIDHNVYVPGQRMTETCVLRLKM